MRQRDATAAYYQTRANRQRPVARFAEVHGRHRMEGEVVEAWRHRKHRRLSEPQHLHDELLAEDPVEEIVPAEPHDDELRADPGGRRRDRRRGIAERDVERPLRIAAPPLLRDPESLHLILDRDLQRLPLILLIVGRDRHLGGDDGSWRIHGQQLDGLPRSRRDCPGSPQRCVGPGGCVGRHQQGRGDSLRRLRSELLLSRVLQRCGCHGLSWAAYGEQPRVLKGLGASGIP
jgi:hypothetical protein